MKFTARSLPAACASKDPGRYAWNACRLRLVGEGDDRRPVLEATDGKRLTRIPLDLEPGESFPEDEAGDAAEVLLDAADLREAFKGGGKTATRRLFEEDEATWYVETRSARGQVTRTRIRTMVGEFPNVDSVLEHAPEVEGEVHVNADFLREVLAALGDAPNSAGTTLVTLRFRGAKAPLEIVRRATGDAPEASGLVMPITLEVE